MTFSKNGDKIILELSQQEYNTLAVMFGYATAAVRDEPESIMQHLGLINGMIQSQNEWEQRAAAPAAEGDTPL